MAMRYEVRWVKKDDEGTIRVLCTHDKFDQAEFEAKSFIKRSRYCAAVWLFDTKPNEPRT